MRYSRYRYFRPFQFLVQPFWTILGLTILFVIVQRFLGK